LTILPLPVLARREKNVILQDWQEGEYKLSAEDTTVFTEQLKMKEKSLFSWGIFNNEVFVSLVKNL